MERGAADEQCGWYVEGVGTHQYHVGSLDRHVGAGTDGDAEVGLGQRRSVVDAVADHGGPTAVAL